LESDKLECEEILLYNSLLKWGEFQLKSHPKKEKEEKKEKKCRVKISHR